MSLAALGLGVSAASSPSSLYTNRCTGFSARRIISSGGDPERGLRFTDVAGDESSSSLLHARGGPKGSLRFTGAAGRLRVRTKINKELTWF